MLLPEAWTSGQLTRPVWIALYLFLASFAFLVISRWIAPFILRRISKRIRVRSISFRSIKGLYFNSGAFTIRLERIGLSYRRRPPDNLRRFTLKVHGLQIELHPQNRLPTYPAQKAPNIIIRLVYNILAMLSSMDLFKIFYFITSWMRPLVKMFVVTSGRLLIRYLPAVTQSLDLEVDNIVISHKSFAGAYALFRGIQVSTKVIFSQLEGVMSSLEYDHGRAPVASPPHSIWAGRWTTRLKASVSRTWEKAWGSTEGFVSTSFTLDQFSVFRRHASFSPDGRQGSNSDHAYVSVLQGDRSNMSSILEITNPTRLKVSASFTPRSVRWGDGSVRIEVKLPDVAVDAHNIKSCLDDYHSQFPKTSEVRPAGQGPDDNSSKPAMDNSQLMGRLKTAMMVNRFRRSIQASMSRRQKRRRRLEWLTLMDLFDVEIRDFAVTYQKTGVTTRTRFVFSNQVARIRCSRSPIRNGEDELNSNLSSLDDSKDKHRTIFTNLHLAETHCFLVRDTEPGSAEHPIVSVDAIDISCVNKNWPLFVQSELAFVRDDPNACFIAVNATIGDVTLESDALGFEDLLHIFRSDLQQPELRQAAVTFLPVPQIDLTFHTGRLACRIWPEGVRLRSRPHIETDTAGFTLGVQVSYQYEWEFASLPDFDDKLQSKLVLQSSAHFFLDAIHLRALSETRAASTIPSYSNLNGYNHPDVEPIVSMASYDGTFNILGTALYDNEEMPLPLVDMFSLFFDVRVTTDDVGIQLWNQPSVAILSSIVSAMHSAMHSSSQEKAASVPSPKSALRMSISCFFSVAQLTILITGKDINPSCDLNLSRGLSLKSGVFAQYCSLSDRVPMRRARALRSDAHARQRLGLPEDLLLQASAQVSSSDSKAESLQIMQLQCTSTMIRHAVATAFSADSSHIDIPDKFFHHAEAEFMFLHMPTLLIRYQRTLPSSGEKRHSLNSGLVKLPTVSVNLGVLSGYNVLLASQTFQHILPSSKQRNLLPSEPQMRHRDNWRIHVEALQIHIHLPLEQQVVVTSKKIDLRTKGHLALEAKVKLAALLVPSLHGQGRWRNLACVRDLLLETKSGGPTTRSPSFNFTASAVIFRIPWRYVVADLILSITISFKALRHLRKVVPTGRFQAVEPPPAELPKHVPSLAFVVEALVIEAEDDPFEARLGTIWRAGAVAQSVRQERDGAFEAKVAAIKLSEENDVVTAGSTMQSSFDSTHSVSVQDARWRLDAVHAAAWLLHVRDQQATDRERSERHSWEGESVSETNEGGNYKMDPAESLLRAPIFRLAIHGVQLSISEPTLVTSGIQSFLSGTGGPLPHDTRFSLCIPLRIDIKAASFKLTARDYPLPILHIPSCKNSEAANVHFMTDVVIAEELGDQSSVLWLDCKITDASGSDPCQHPFVLQIPKTVMPVKLYANPSIIIKTSGITDITWGISYMPCLQSIAKVIDSLTHPPPDPSPPLGFWDKIRLVLHGKATISFDHDVHLHLKGARDPYQLSGEGAGFTLCWSGQPQLEIGHNNPEREVVQLKAADMQIVIPDLSRFTKQRASREHTVNSHYGNSKPKKIIANLTGGIQMGIGLQLERSCDDGCSKCSARSRSQGCRIFTFKPHYDVHLKARSDATRSDSFLGFRSDFIHFSMSLLTPTKGKSGMSGRSNTVHLSGLTFAHFWRWWSLFDGSMSLPIGHGALYPDARPPSPKFGKHLGTIKYRIAISNVFIAHVYAQDTLESWDEGETHMVGIKFKVEDFRADLHQRDQQTTAISQLLPPTKTSHKVFNAAEVSFDGIVLKTMYAVFSSLDSDGRGGPRDPTTGLKKPWENAPHLDASSDWSAQDDWVELDWRRESQPRLYIAEVGRCPHFIYFKTLPSESTASEVTSDPQGEENVTRFGGEDTHMCSIGVDPSTQSIQRRLAIARLNELSGAGAGMTRLGGNELPQGTQKSISHLQRYIQQLESEDNGKAPEPVADAAHHTPSNEWKRFVNIYHVHSPTVNLSNVTRNIMMQYYYASRARRGFEYHMASRAVKFIRDQGNTVLQHANQSITKRPWRPSASAQAAAHVIRKILVRDDSSKTVHDETSFSDVNASPSESAGVGWSSKDVTIRRSHYCLLLKPQVVLQSERSADSTIILASATASLQSFAIMDKSNIDDPINGRIMTRNYASLTGLQGFAPTSSAGHMGGRHNCVPLEVLVDYRCETTDFDRIIPKTDASLQYDKFNRLRLRNKVSTVGRIDFDGDQQLVDHLQHHMDLVVVIVPRIAVSADSHRFGVISNVVTDLLLYSDPLYKTHAEELENYMILYDFHDLSEAAKVVTRYQDRIRELLAAAQDLQTKNIGSESPALVSLGELKVQILTASQELGLIFEAIKLAQDKAHNKKTDEKMAFRLVALLYDVSWQMFDGASDLLAKLSVKGVYFSWLSRQDSSTVNKLVVRDLQAFDGSQQAVWPELLSKNSEPPSHPLVKREIFADADWCVLPAVGGISIYERFFLELHPIRLQIDTTMGTRIMEYVWPARGAQHEGGSTVAAIASPDNDGDELISGDDDIWINDTNASWGYPADSSPLSDLPASRSHSDLTDTLSVRRPALKRSQSFSSPFNEPVRSAGAPTNRPIANPDAVVMRNRSSQKAFIMVHVASLHLLLSIMKEDAFLCRGARIRTRELIFRNQTWSFEELAHQFIPSDPSWKGWIRMALHQPLLPVLPVAKELISKTKWGSITPRVASPGPSTGPSIGKPARRHLKRPQTLGSPDRHDTEEDKAETRQIRKK